MTSTKTILGCGALLAGLITLVVGAMLVGWIGHTPAEPPLRTADVAPAVAPAAPAPPLLLGEWHWRRRGEMWVEIEGEVANVSASPLPSVQAIASYYTESGSFLASDSAMIEYRPLAPGQTSPFSITTEWRDGMAVAKLAFKRYGGEAIPHADANEPDPTIP